MDPKETKKSAEELMNNLRDLAEPIRAWLESNGDPHVQVIISLDQIRLVSDLLGIPLSEETKDE